MKPIDLTLANFNTETTEAGIPVLIDFWASWCGPCKMLLPIIDEVAAEATNAKICKVNVDEQPAIASKFKIMSVPTLIVMKDGQVVNTTVGVKSKEEILSMLNV